MSPGAHAPGRAAIGVFGGTFDPVHCAHLALARRAREALGLVRVLWLPTGRPPYRDAPVAPAAHRVEMLRLALAGETGHALDLRELDPAHSGYTIDSLAALRAELGAQTGLVLLMGADQYAKLASWHRADELPRFARIGVFARPGAPLGATPAHVEVLAMPPQDVSSSEIRRRLARGEPVAALVPPAVLHYIQREGLYR